MRIAFQSTKEDSEFYVFNRFNIWEKPWAYYDKGIEHEVKITSQNLNHDEFIKLIQNGGE